MCVHCTAQITKTPKKHFNVPLLLQLCIASSTFDYPDFVMHLHSADFAKNLKLFFMNVEYKYCFFLLLISKLPTVSAVQ